MNRKTGLEHLGRLAIRGAIYEPPRVRPVNRAPLWSGIGIVLTALGTVAWMTLLL